jgi:glycosyltransferase EpsD
MTFHVPYLKWFKNNGFETHVCARNDYDRKEDCIIPFCDKFYDIPFERSPFKPLNIEAYKELKNIIADNDYDIIHCHTPVGGALARIAARNYRKRGTKVIYTAHGFHFFEGSPVKNWILYYPLEKWLSRFTDVLITLNEEDYNTALAGKFKAKKIVKVNGVGVNLDKFTMQTDAAKIALRKEYGYSPKDYVLIYVGELIHRKNQEFLINALAKTVQKIPNIKLLLVGDGNLKEHYRNLIKKIGIEDNVELLGYRNDVPKLMLLSDVLVSSSRQEGLPVNVMEGMAVGLPLLVTNCRGNRDLVKDSLNGFLVELDNVDMMSNKIEDMYHCEKEKALFKINNLQLIKQYSIESVLKEMQEIYRECL